MTGYWYIIHIYSGHEKKVKINLDQRVQALRLDEEILQVIVPMKQIVEIKNGKKRVFERPSYPGYILVQTQHALAADAEEEATRKSWYTIRETPGVMGFVGASGPNPTPLNESEVQNILDTSMTEEKQTPDITLDYAVGDMVKVIEGPFNGFSAEIKGIDIDRQRLNVVITLFGRLTPIELEFLEVEKI